MKKLIIFVLFNLFVFASSNNVEILFSTLKFNYKEYQNSKVLDSESSDFSDLPGIDFTFERFFNKNKLNLNFEYNKGSTLYRGSTWGGTPLKHRSKNAYLFNSRIMFGYFLKEDVTDTGKGNFYFTSGIGYRFWNRGKSNYEGDYDEKYKWSYYLIGMNARDYFYNFSFAINVFYHQAISPKMEASLGSGATYKLGKTDGYRIEIPLKFSLQNNYGIIFKYIYDYWHIRKSDPEEVVIDGKTYSTYEPDSKTKNFYLNLGFFINF